MKSFQNFLTEDTDSLEGYLTEFQNALVSTHDRVNMNGHTMFLPKNENSSFPNKMIVSCFHGDEPAGWLGLLEFVKKYNVDSVNVSYLPIISGDVFRSGKHLNEDGENPNLMVSSQPSKEMKRLLEAKDMWLPRASDGFLDLHEDPWRGEGYVFSWSDTGDLTDRMVENLSQYFPLFNKGVLLEDPQDMLGEYLARFGVSPSITHETPVLDHELEERIEATILAIKEFLS